MRVASSEAQSAFGDGGVFLERYLSPVRHVEIQILADTHGNAVALGERECSVQRRHQKLLEESPSTVIDQATRERMMAAGVAAAKASGYDNAGTVEFLFDPATQRVLLPRGEHAPPGGAPGDGVAVRAATSCATRSASRRASRSASRRTTCTLRGAAIECRIAAEDPYNNYLPSLGRIDFVSEPSGPGVRVDSSIFSGIEIPYFYDPMLAKLICWGADRAQAIERMKRALREYVIVGVKTNIPFHLQLLDDPRFVAGEVHTGFLDNEFKMIEPDGHGDDDTVALLVAAVMSHNRRARNGAQPAVIAGSGATAGAPPGATASWRAARPPSQQGSRWRRSIG